MHTVGTEDGDKEMWRGAEAKSQRTWKELKVTWRCIGAMQTGGDDGDPSEIGERRTVREGSVLWVLLIGNPLLILFCVCVFS